MMDLTGNILGNVELTRIIGEGASGVVYLGKHTTLNKDVAVKVLKQEKYGDDPRYKERFRREAQLAASLDHPGIVRVIDCHDDDKMMYLVMDHIDGYPFSHYLDKFNKPAEELTVLKVLIAVSQALQAAHKAGVVHRDLKPANIIISRRGSLHLTDLGLAKQTGSTQFTQDKMVVGSPAYMSPEALTPGLEVDGRTDLYALGIIGYQLLFGCRPYSGDLPHIFQGHLAGNAKWDKESRCSKQTIAVIKKLMATNRSDRYKSALELLNDIRPLYLTLSKRKKKLTADGSGSSQSNSLGSTTSDFTGFVQFLDQTFGSHTTTHQGGHVTHTTKSERIIVWLLLCGLLAVIIFVYILSQN